MAGHAGNFYRISGIYCSVLFRFSPLSVKSSAKRIRFLYRLKTIRQKHFTTEDTEDAEKTQTLRF